MSRIAGDKKTTSQNNETIHWTKKSINTLRPWLWRRSPRHGWASSESFFQPITWQVITT